MIRTKNTVYPLAPRDQERQAQGRRSEEGSRGVRWSMTGLKLSQRAENKKWIELSIRRPVRLYGTGDEPDPRFSLANERTLLAWLRTSLALVVAGTAALGLEQYITPGWLGEAVAVGAFVSGAAGATGGVAHWWRVEAALRLRQPLPSSGYAMILAGVIILMAIVGVVVLVGG